ncbi:MAG: hypothetical protein KAI61_02350 [Alphaproteobacteria bacterium]|nr:hypothetical protein [Alphaproteobacteria bacterium]
MPQEIKIVCGKDLNAYRVILTGKSLDFSENVEKKAAFKGMKGEELVTTILAAGDVLKIERHRNGMRTDGSHGEPSVQKFDDRNGRLWRKEHHKLDLLNDGTNGEPAVQEFNRNGNTTRIEHRIKNKRHDSANGKPAIQDFDKNGKPSYTAHCINDKYNDTKNELALQYFNNGILTRGVSYNNSELIKELTAQEIPGYLKSRKKQATKNAAPCLKL